MLNWGKVFSRRRVTGVFLAAAAGWLSTLMWPATNRDHVLKQPFVSAERIGLDALFAVRGPRNDRIDPRIAVVGFTRQSETNLDSRWPVRRSWHAKVLENLMSDGAKLVVFDALFSDASTKEDDIALDRALKRAKEVVIAQRIDRDSIQRQKALEYPYYDDALAIDFESAALPGLAEVQLDSDDVVRSFVPAMVFQGEWTPSLATAAYLKLHGLEASSLSVDRKSFRIDGKSFGHVTGSTIDAVDGSPIVSLSVDYPAGMDAFFSSYSYDQVLNGEFPKGSFAGKVVFVGVTGFEQARELDDLYTITSTQLAMQSGEAAGAINSRSADYGRIPGVFVQAHFLNALLTNGFLKPVPPVALGIGVGSLTLLGIAVARRYLNWRGPVFIFGLALAYFLTTIALFEYGQVHLPYVVPISLFGASVAIIAWLERAGLKKRWSGYVSIDVLEQILKSEDDAIAKRHDAVVMFGDIRGFTTFSDRHDPELVVKLLNRHFERFTDAIFAERGAIDKFMGDGVIVVFGAPVKLENSALRAVRAALAMRDLSLQPMLDDGKEYVFETGFGIASGPFVAGHVGSRRRHDFTVIGDVVNTSSRLQGITGKPDVVIDQATYEAVADSVEVESLGAVALKGKEVPVTCYRVIGLKKIVQAD